VEKLRFPQEFVVRREVYGFGPKGRLERIPPGAVVLASSRSTHKRMIEVIWREKQYDVFERDLQDRMEPLAKPPLEDDPCSVLEDGGTGNEAEV